MFDFEIYKNRLLREVCTELDLEGLNEELEFGSAAYVKQTINEKIAEIAKDSFDELSLKEKKELSSHVTEKYLKNLDNIMIAAHYSGDNLYISTYVEQLLCVYIKDNAEKKQEEKQETKLEAKTEEKQKKQGFFARLFGRKEKVEEKENNEDKNL